MFTKFMKFTRRIAAVLCFAAILSLPVLAAPTFVDELAERVDGSPLQMLQLLHDSLVQGETALEVEFDGWLGRERLAMQLNSDVENLDFMMSVDFVAPDAAIDFVVYANTDRVAVASSTLGNRAIGANFATLADDLPAILLSVLGSGMQASDLLALAEIAELMDVFELFTSMEMDTDATWESFLLEILPLILQHSEQSTSVVNGNQRHGIEIDMIGLSSAYVQILALNQPEMVVQQWRDMVYLLEEFDALTLTLVVDIDENGRMVQAGAVIGMTETWVSWAGVEEELAYAFGVTFDFGSHALDTWEIILEMESNGHVASASIYWEVYAPCENSIDHRFVYRTPNMFANMNIFDDFIEWMKEQGIYEDFNVWEESGNDGYAELDTWLSRWDYFYQQQDLVYDHVALGILWNRESGAITLFAEEYFNGQLYRDEIAGVLNIAGSGFHLHFELDDVIFTLVANTGVPVPTVDFLPPAQWPSIGMFVSMFTDPSPTPWLLRPPLMQAQAVEPLLEIPIVFAQSGEFVLDPAVLEHIITHGVTEPILISDLVSTIDPVMPVLEIAGPYSTATVTSYYLHLRRGPGVDFAAYNHLTHGDIVTVLERRGNWVRVYTQHGEGWVFGAYIE